MNKLICLSALLCLFGFNSLAQSTCKLDVDKVDKVSGERYIIKRYKLKNKYNSLSIGSLGQKGYIQLLLSYLGDKYEVIKKETDTLSIRLANNDLIKLLPFETSKGNSYFHHGYKQIVTEYTPVYYLTDEQFKQLSESPIIAFSVLVENKPQIVEFKDSRGEKIMEGFKCVLQSR